jgi:hypothetical protein
VDMIHSIKTDVFLVWRVFVLRSVRQREGLFVTEKVKRLIEIEAVRENCLVVKRNIS